MCLIGCGCLTASVSTIVSNGKGNPLLHWNGWISKKTVSGAVYLSLVILLEFININKKGLIMDNELLTMIKKSKSKFKGWRCSNR